ncbi:porin family protein [Halomonas dongshanensis]|uniref:Porin family protein n=1 Tax=Halomonas dongshanensis TaxID=2890835 RepID=A0ABT2EAS4_9GAMM|nr:porin family protein [Halomonas dongshanensis]MCS2608687.1 porin family protein [Halomonas dongshanensis]
MKTTLFCATSIAALLTSAQAIAQSTAGYTQGTTYYGAQVSQFDYEQSIDLGFTQGTATAKPPVFIARIGHFLSDYVAIEGRLGTSLNDDSVEFNAAGIGDIDNEYKVEVDHIAGVYGVGHLPLGQSASLFAVLGYTSAEATLSGYGTSETSDDSGISYGGGIQALFTPNVSASVEYMSYLNKSEYDVKAISVGANYHF